MLTTTGWACSFGSPNNRFTLPIVNRRTFDFRARCEFRLGLALAGTCDYAEAKVRQACVAAQVVAFNYSTEAILHRRDVLDWQLFAGKMIFVVVALLVLSGLGFAYLQFRRAAKVALKSPKNEHVDLPLTELELSLQKIKVSSSILGVII